MMKLKGKTVALAIAIFGVAVLLQACSPSAKVAQDVTDSAPPPPTTITVEVPRRTESTTIQLLRILDEGGCDFGLVTITEGAVRKGSSALAIGCK